MTIIQAITETIDSDRCRGLRMDNEDDRMMLKSEICVVVSGVLMDKAGFKMCSVCNAIIPDGVTAYYIEGLLHCSSCEEKVLTSNEHS